jgi:predicted choloylglycine hydrolase
MICRRLRFKVLSQVINIILDKHNLAVIMSNIRSQTFSGTHFEIGIQQGQAMRELIHKALKQIPNLESVKAMKPPLLPTSLFIALAKRRAVKLLRNDIFEYYPKQAQRLKGIAEGASIDMSALLFLQSIELLALKPSYRPEACTSFGVNPQKTTTDETFVGKNLDLPEDLSTYQLTSETRAKEGYKTLGCTMAPFPGMIDGLNEHGLAVTYNLGYTTEKPSCYVPLSMVIQEMLETCKNTNEAIQFITQAKRGGHDALLLLADAEGNMKAVEITSNHVATRKPRDGVIINTNHYHTTEMQKHEVPHNAVFFGKVPKVLLGVRVHESSEQRLKRAQELLKAKGKVDESKIATILRDHGKDNKPSMFTICRHSKILGIATTIRSIILFPKRKAIKVLYGNPCQNKYNEFTFS